MRMTTSLFGLVKNRRSQRILILAALLSLIIYIVRDRVSYRAEIFIGAKLYHSAKRAETDSSQADWKSTDEDSLISSERLRDLKSGKISFSSISKLIVKDAEDVNGMPNVPEVTELPKSESKTIKNDQGDELIAGRNDEQDHSSHTDSDIPNNLNITTDGDRPVVSEPSGKLAAALSKNSTGGESETFKTQPVGLNPIDDEQPVTVNPTFQLDDEAEMTLEPPKLVPNKPSERVIVPLPIHVVVEMDAPIPIPPEVKAENNDPELTDGKAKKNPTPTDKKSNKKINAKPVKINFPENGKVPSQAGSKKNNTPPKEKKEKKQEGKKVKVNYPVPMDHYDWPLNVDTDKIIAEYTTGKPSIDPITPDPYDIVVSPPDAFCQGESCI